MYLFGKSGGYILLRYATGRTLGFSDTNSHTVSEQLLTTVYSLPLSPRCCTPQEKHSVCNGKGKKGTVPRSYLTLPLTNVRKPLGVLRGYNGGGGPCWVFPFVFIFFLFVVIVGDVAISVYGTKWDAFENEKRIL